MTCGQRVNHQRRHRLVYPVVAAATTVVVGVIISSTLIGSERVVLGPFSNSRPVAAMPILGNEHSAVPRFRAAAGSAWSLRLRPALQPIDSPYCWLPSTFQRFHALQESPVKYI